MGIAALVADDDAAGTARPSAAETGEMRAPRLRFDLRIAEPDQPEDGHGFFRVDDAGAEHVEAVSQASPMWGGTMRREIANVLALDQRPRLRGVLGCGRSVAMVTTGDGPIAGSRPRWKTC